MECIGERIRLLRKKFNMTQLKLAKVLEVSEKTVSAWEKGERYPKQNYIYVIAHYFGTSEKYLVNGADSDGNIPFSEHVIVTEKKVELRTRSIMELGDVSSGVVTFNQNYHKFSLEKFPSGTLVAVFCRDFCLSEIGIRPRDILLVENDLKINNGAISVIIYGGEIHIGKLYYYPDKEIVLVKPANPSYSTLSIEGKCLNYFTYIGKVRYYKHEDSDIAMEVPQYLDGAEYNISVAAELSKDELIELKETLHKYIDDLISL